MKGYAIDAGARTIKPVEYQDFTTMLEYCPGGICVGHIFKNGDVLYVDETGLLRPATVAFRIKKRVDGQPMMSNGFLGGPDAPDGESTLDAGMTVAELENEIEWLTVQQALGWFRARAHKGAQFIKSGDEPAQVLNTWATYLKILEGGMWR